MRRATLWGLLLLATTAGAQTAPAPVSAASARETVRFLREAWQVVRTEGAQGLNRWRREWPLAFRQLEDHTRALADSARAGEGDWRDRARLLGEFWRLRGAVSLVALLEPEVLANVTGLNPDEVRALDGALKKIRPLLVWAGYNPLSIS